MKAKSKSGECNLHHIQFYNLLPRGISCSAVNSENSKLALSRDDGTIEIWNLSAAPFLEKSIPGGENVSIEGLAWVGDRLFSVGLAGALLEWDLRLLKVKTSLLLTGDAGWCLDVSKDARRLAVGTEGGYINIYDVEQDEINYEKILDKQEGRIVSIRFDYSGDFLVTGSADAVRVWNAKKGHAIHKMTTGRAERNKETIVWDILVLRDFTIISGDSRGKIMFFDGNLGTSVDSISVSKADILCLAIDDEEKTLYVSGIEPIVRLFQRVEVTKANEKVNSFTRSISRRLHTNDIKTLALLRHELLSGGVDGTLIKSMFPPLTVDKYIPLLEAPSCVLVDESRMVLLKYVNYLEVWTLSSPSVESQKILQIRSKLDEHIVASSISSNGRWIIYSSESKARLYRFDYASEGQSRLVPMRTVPDQFDRCYRVEFTHDSKGVFLFKHEGTIEYFTFTEKDDFDHKQTIETEKYFADKVHLAAISRDDRFLVCASLCTAIIVFQRQESDKWTRLTTLPKYRMPPTAIAIHPNCPILAAVFPDHKIFHYDFSEFKFTFSSYLKLDQLGGSLNKAVSDIVFDPRNDDAMILQHDSDLLVSEFEDCDSSYSETKRKNCGGKNGSEEDQTPRRRYSMKVLKKYSRLVCTRWLGNDELVVIEANPLSMVEYLPPAYRRKVFGAA
ncbi:U3 small nucleolar RNA-associated protein 4 homolog [Toxorhynchites rutilus septentrionalis]|uniref:U3 small nucleolar RNA-associated protein 4 homolog n=1 Tax=Toxorhynchites rutilus septentrionalis TaxID=329112 RepID=UPI002478E6EC|nr:U3 small nucleolar RNA-associated protein 4 homolog [Toxorhynchites rutilus septentrionalis]